MATFEDICVMKPYLEPILFVFRYLNLNQNEPSM